jgi:hypothetical protein
VLLLAQLHRTRFCFSLQGDARHREGELTACKLTPPSSLNVEIMQFTAHNDLYYYCHSSLVAILFDLAVLDLTIFHVKSFIGRETPDLKRVNQLHSFDAFAKE